MNDGYRKVRRKVGRRVYLCSKNYQAAHLRLEHLHSLCYIYYISKKINSNIDCYKNTEAIFLKLFTFKWLRPDVSMFNTCACLK